MRVRTRGRRLTVVVVCLVSAAANGAVLSWNPGGSNAGSSDGSGTWTTNSGTWWNGTANVAWTSGNQAVFGAGTDGTYSVEIGDSITTTNGTSTTGGLNFLNSGYTLSSLTPQTIFVGNNASGSVNSFIRVAAGKTATIGPNLTVRRNGGAGGQLHLVGGGTLEVAPGGTLLNSYTNLNEVANGSTLWLNGGTVTYGSSLIVGQITAGIGLGGTVTLDSGSLTLATGNLLVGRSVGDVSTVSLAAGSLSVTAGHVRTDNGAATLNLNGGTLTATQFYRSAGTLDIVLNGGTLRAAATSLTDFLRSSITSVTVAGGGVTFDTNGRSITANVDLVGGSGTGGVAKIGAGELTLAGSSNTYTGPTNVDGGTLLVTGGLGATTVSVAAGATLGGSGSISGPTSILAGGTLAPGTTTPGTLTITANPLVIDDAAIVSFALNAADTTVGGGINDLVTGVSDLTIGGTLDLTGTGDFSAVTSGTTWRLFNYTGTLTDNGLAIGTVPSLAAGLSFLVDTSVASEVSVSVVPEPAAFLMGGAAITLIGRLFCRRRRAAPRSNA